MLDGINRMWESLKAGEQNFSAPTAGQKTEAYSDYFVMVIHERLLTSRDSSPLVEAPKEFR